jgi:hypothetical protein
VRHALVDLKFSFDTRAAQLAMGQHRKAQKKIAS